MAQALTKAKTKCVRTLACAAGRVSPRITCSPSEPSTFSALPIAFVVGTCARRRAALKASPSPRARARSATAECPVRGRRASVTCSPCEPWSICASSIVLTVDTCARRRAVLRVSVSQRQGDGGASGRSRPGNRPTFSPLRCWPWSTPVRLVELLSPSEVLPSVVAPRADLAPIPVARECLIRVERSAPRK